jgi:tetratricopeptide (TPR) repeat protein
MGTLTHPSISRGLFCLAFAFALVGAVPLDTAHAQDATQAEVDERARVHFTSGRAYFDSGEYERALQEFQQAYALSQREELHYNLFLCQERIGNVSEAIRELEAFLATNPPTRATLEPRLTALRVRERQEAEAEAVREQERLAAQQRAEAAEARAREAEERASQSSTGAAGDGEASGGGLHTGAIIGYGVGAAGLITFGVAGIMVVTGDSGLTRGCLAAGTCTESQLDRQDRRALVADIGLGIGLAGAVTGLVIHLVTRGGDDAEESEESSASARVHVSPWLGRGGAGAAVAGTF